MMHLVNRVKIEIIKFGVGAAHAYGAAVAHLTKLLISAKLKELTRVLEIVLLERAVNFT